MQSTELTKVTEVTEATWDVVGPRIEFMAKHHSFRATANYEGDAVTCSVVTKTNYLLTVQDTSVLQAAQRCWLLLNAPNQEAYVRAA